LLIENQKRVSPGADFQSAINNQQSAIFVSNQQSSMPTGTTSRRVRSDLAFYVLAALAGIGTGWVDVAVNDLLFTALLVLMACMLLGLLRPGWPWRWVAVVTIFIPLTELAAYVIMTVKPTRGQMYGSFLTALPGMAGAYGGAVMRRVIDNLRQGK
jgi:ABC-type multidrug transport system permease subunit